MQCLSAHQCPFKLSETAPFGLPFSNSAIVCLCAREKSTEKAYIGGEGTFGIRQKHATYEQRKKKV